MIINSQLLFRIVEISIYIETELIMQKVNKITHLVSLSQNFVMFVKL